MKIFAINGSPRRGGNTEIMLQKVLTPLREAGHTTELFHLGGAAVRGCMACGLCKKRKNSKCSIESDPINEVIGKMATSDVILVGSPVYFSNVTTEIKALIDRAGYVCRANDFLLKHKIGAAVVAVRRAGALHTFNSINQFFHINQMIMPGSTYWNLGIGGAKGEVATDEEGMINMANLAENIDWLATRLRGSGSKQ